MLKVTNGVVTVTVTRGAFNSYFKHAGFHVVNGANSPESEGVGKYHPAPDSPEDEDENQTGEDEESYTKEYLDEQGNESEEQDEESEEEETEEEKAVDYSEIPLSELGFDQLMDYADQLGIDRKGVRSKKELRAAIREYLKK